MKSKRTGMAGGILLGVIGVAAKMAAAQAPSPALAVVLKDENAMAIVDVKAGKVVGRVPVGEGPHEVAASDDGKLAFVTNYGPQNAQIPGSSLSVIDLAAQKELRRVEIGPAAKPHGVFFLGGKAYFTAEGFKLIGRYDPAVNKIDWLLGTGQNRTHMVIVSKDLNKIFTANINSDSVSAFARAGNPPDWTGTVIPVGKNPEGIDFSPDGKEVWTATWGDGGVSIIDVAAKKVVQTLNIHAQRSNRLKFTPDGKYVLVSDLGGSEVVVLDGATRKEIKRLKPGKNPTGILMTPDGSRAYIAASGSNQLAILDLKTLEITGRIPMGANPDGMAWVQPR